MDEEGEAADAETEEVRTGGWPGGTKEGPLRGDSSDDDDDDEDPPVDLLGGGCCPW